MNKPAGYLRVSAQEAVEGYSLEAQERAIRAFCSAKGWPDPLLYGEPGRSAYTDVTEQRPQFAAMLDAATSGQHDVVIVHKLDRFARSLLVSLRELQRLDRAGVSFVSVMEQIDFTTPIGKVLLALLAAFAQYYSDNLSAEIKKGLHEKRRQGKHIGTPPYGALRVDGVLSVNPDKADDLRTILTLCATRSNQAVADELNHLGIPARHGGIWHDSAVHYFRASAGWLEEQGEGWATLARAIVARPRAHPVAHTDTIRTLTSLLRCTCGGVICYHTVTATRRWGRCRNAANPGRKGCRDWGTIEQLERAAEDWLFALTDPRTTVSVREDTTPRADFDARRRRVVQLYRDGLLSEGEYVAERAALLAAETRLPVAAGRREAVGVGLAVAREQWATWDEVARNALYRTLVRHFVVDHGTLTPCWRSQMLGVWGGGMGD